jgi:trehalose-phosphatase
VRDVPFDPSELVAAAVHERLAGRHLLLLTDFDGTLAGLAPRPADAVMSAAVRHEFERLSAGRDVDVGVVSGRRLIDVQARVGPAAEFVAGLHGLEIDGPDGSLRHFVLDDVEPVVRELANLAVRELAWCPGLLLEDKQYALTCHVRRTPEPDASLALEEFAALVEPMLEARVLKLLPSTKAFEVLPAVDWHKGRAVSWIRTRVERRIGRPVGVVYLGDDRTDEDAFTALREDDAAIGVGPRPHTHLIEWRLAGPESVGRFFKKLAEIRDTESETE